MTHAVLVQNKVAALNIDALNRPAVSASAIDNGNVFNLLTNSTSSGSEVWVATVPATGSLVNLWMAYEPEIVITVSGNSKYKGLDPDIRNFYTPAGTVFSAFKPQLGDILLMTAAGFTSGSVTEDFAVAKDGAYLLDWAAAPITGLTLKLLETSYISLATGAIDSQRVTAYRLEVIGI